MTNKVEDNEATVSWQSRTKKYIKPSCSQQWLLLLQGHTGSRLFLLNHQRWLWHHSQETQEAYSFSYKHLFCIDCSSQVANHLSNSYQQRKGLALQDVTQPVAKRGLNAPASCGDLSSRGLVARHMGVQNCSGLNPRESFLLKGTAGKLPFSVSSLPGPGQEKAGTLHITTVTIFPAAIH